MHHVAAAEALRILERRGVQHLAALQVGQVHCDGGGAGVYRQAIDFAAVGVHAVAFEIHAVAAAVGRRVRVEVAAHPGGEDTRLAAQKRELDFGVRIDDRRLARQAVVIAQKRLRRCVGRQRVHAAPDLDDALVALAVPAARRGYADSQRIRVVEDGLAGYGLEPRRAV